MRIKILIGLCILSVAAGVYCFRSAREPAPAALNTSPETKLAKGQGIEAKSEPDIFAKAIAEANLPSNYILTAEERETVIRKAREKALLPTTEELKSMFDTPVEFYGQVLNQFDQPVVGAKISCSWPYMGPQYSAWELQSSAPNGQFEILGLKGVSIHVSVFPPLGYDEQVKESEDIQFARTPVRILQNEDYKAMTPDQKEMWGKMHGFGEAHKPDKTKPVIFRLKKL